MLSSNRFLGLPTRIFPRDFSTKILQDFYLPSLSIRQAEHRALDFITLIIQDGLYEITCHPDARGSKFL